MYSIRLGHTVLEFQRALIHAPHLLPHPGTACLLPGFLPQQIEVKQCRDHALVCGLDGFGRERGAHRVEVVTPGIVEADGVLDYLTRQANVAADELGLVRDAIECADYPCGRVFCLNLGALGFAPGGRRYCLLPHGMAAISTGFLCLDWKTVAVHTH